MRVIEMRSPLRQTMRSPGPKAIASRTVLARTAIRSAAQAGEFTDQSSGDRSSQQRVARQRPPIPARRQVIVAKVALVAVVVSQLEWWRVRWPFR